MMQPWRIQVCQASMAHSDATWPSLPRLRRSLALSHFRRPGLVARGTTAEGLGQAEPAANGQCEQQSHRHESHWSDEAVVHAGGNPQKGFLEDELDNTPLLSERKDS